VNFGLRGCMPSGFYKTAEQRVKQAEQN